MRTPALYALFFFLAGILLATYTSVPTLFYLALSIAAASLTLIFRLQQAIAASRVTLCFAVLTGAAFRTELQTSEFPSNHVVHFTGRNELLTITGQVVDEPDIRPTRTYLVVAVDSIALQQRTIKATGRIRLQIQESTSRFDYRDRLKFTGYLNQPQSGRNPGAFDYQDYLRIRDIYALVVVPSAPQVRLLQSGGGDPFIRHLVVPVRNYISAVLEKHRPSDQAALIKGFLIGDVRFISGDVYQKFKDTGTLHVLAASGANVGYLIFTVFLFLKLSKLPRNSRYMLTLAAVAVFSFLAYNQPSVVRASLMAITALVGRALFRDTNYVNIASFSALAILAFRPLYLYDIGFQLSYAAAFGLVLFMPAVESWLPNKGRLFNRFMRFPLLILLGTLVAQLAVTPILIYNFHIIPLVSFLSNIVVIPMVGISTSLAIVQIFVSWIPGLAELSGQILTVALTYTMLAIDYFHGLPIPPLRLGVPNLTVILIYYLLLQLVYFFITRRRAMTFALLVLVLSVNMLIWREVIAGENPDLEITFLDTGSQTTAFSAERTGKTLLLNGGGRSEQFDRGETTVLPFLQARGVHRIDRALAVDLEEDNIESMISVLSGVEEKIPSRHPEREGRGYYRQRIEKAGTIVKMGTAHVTIVYLNKSLASHLMTAVPKPADLLAVDWIVLEDSDLIHFVQESHISRVLVASYPHHYIPREPLERFRQRLPDVQLYSTLESGGIRLRIEKGSLKVLTTTYNP